MRHSVLGMFLFFAALLTAESPHEALQDLALAESFQDIKKHLPVAVNEELEHADAARVRSIEEHFQRGLQERKRLTLERGSGDELLVVHLVERNQTGRIKAKRWISDGAHAYFQIEGCDDRECQQMGEVWMEFEDYSWRVTEVRFFPARVSYDKAGMIEYLQRPAYFENEQSAIGSVRTINTASVTYASTYDTGFAPTLRSLGCNDENQPDAQHSCLIDDDLAAGENGGYVFRYQRNSESEYLISARPKEFGRTGKRSFFSDESGVIRYTDENREATVDDSALQ